jgi:hypothetical protein
MDARKTRLHLLLVAIAGLALSGCAAPVKRQIPELQRDPAGPTTIVLMPLDVELGQLTAGGVVQPHAEWTEAAIRHMRAALEKQATGRNLTVVDYHPERGSPEDQATGLELMTLHRAVGGSILLHEYLGGYALPSKKDKFDWSLGPAVGAISRSHAADYALFLYVRDSYATGGRVALIMAAAVLGVGLTGGTQVGYASLVDLKSGDVVWFNRLVRTVGDLRTPEAAEETVKVLLADALK